MASVKIAAGELLALKADYIRAAQNARNVSETLKKAGHSIGSDRMFEETRKSLSTLASLVESRADSIEKLAKVIDTAVEIYMTAQTQSIAAVTAMKVCKTDFYGNPVTVSGSGVSGNVNEYHNETVINHESYETTQNITVNNITNNITNNIIMNNEVPEDTASSDTTSSYIPSSVTDTHYEEPAVIPADPVSEAAAIVSETHENGISRTAVGIGAAVIGGAAAAGAGVAAVKLSSELAEEQKRDSIDIQLAEARKKLHEIEDEQRRMDAKSIPVQVRPGKERKRK